MRADDITPVGLALSPDGKTAYVGLGRANHVAWVDVASTQGRTKQVLVGKRAWGVTLDATARGCTWPMACRTTHGGRRAERQGDEDHPGRPRAVHGGGDR